MHRTTSCGYSVEDDSSHYKFCWLSRQPLSAQFFSFSFVFLSLFILEFRKNIDYLIVFIVLFYLIVILSCIFVCTLFCISFSLSVFFVCLFLFNLFFFFALPVLFCFLLCSLFSSFGCYFLFPVVISPSHSFSAINCSSFLTPFFMKTPQFC